MAGCNSGDKDPVSPDSGTNISGSHGFRSLQDFTGSIWAYSGYSVDRACSRWTWPVPWPLEDYMYPYDLAQFDLNDPDEYPELGPLATVFVRANKVDEYGDVTISENGDNYWDSGSSLTPFWSLDHPHTAPTLCLRNANPVTDFEQQTFGLGWLEGNSNPTGAYLASGTIEPAD